MASVKIRIDQLGRGTVELDGLDISDQVTAIECAAIPNKTITKVKLTLVVKELDFEAEKANVEKVPA